MRILIKNVHIAYVTIHVAMSRDERSKSNILFPFSLIFKIYLISCTTGIMTIYNILTFCRFVFLSPF